MAGRPTTDKSRAFPFAHAHCAIFFLVFNASQCGLGCIFGIPQGLQKESEGSYSVADPKWGSGGSTFNSRAQPQKIFCALGARDLSTVPFPFISAHIFLRLMQLQPAAAA
jgi:hypothetical protein